MKHNKYHHDEGEHWLSVSDMMSGLMVIFLFIAVTYMMQVTEDRKQLVEIAVTYEKTKNTIYDKLKLEFQDDLKKWNAEIDQKTLAFRFKEPDVLFGIGETDLKDKFKDILRDFFPRYIEILEQYRNDIEEIRIEGHTSSEWTTSTNADTAYFMNMALSQDRTRATLEYCLMLPDVYLQRKWIKQILTANGLSSSKPILTDGNEDSVHSRRVEFKIKTNSETQILKILQKK
jgi:outer membrane protein OmpA-like peptidoglycan-associated protein